MNYIKEAENYLKHYGDMYESIENMDKEISRLIRESGPQDITAIQYDITGIPGGCKQDEAINVLFKIQILTENRHNTKKELEKIDKILDEISEEEGCEFYGQVLRKWYIERVPKEDIAESIGYSSRQSIYTLKGKAIRKFSIRLFGLEALKMI
ncbi:hypothetical protein KQI42_15810 [Tissierella sp. MSJ-40]|uniref:Transcriptional regulator n=1 Tax=Tissierella simiarum TaxID=2841534 RepID=A0ABS6E9G3_9FIRM|nr:hypothetical protein [Tissierella simiarum]MBU5439481.1 hypothetical protein [Tissierella simiarum]